MGVMYHNIMFRIYYFLLLILILHFTCKKALDDGKFAALLLMDLSKAFDCLPHDLMTDKLVAYGMSHEAVRLLMSYLRDRKQRARLGEHTGEWMTLLKDLF